MNKLNNYNILLEEIRKVIQLLNNNQILANKKKFFELKNYF